MDDAIEPADQRPGLPASAEAERAHAESGREAERRRFLVGSVAVATSTAIAGCATTDGGAGGASGSIVGTEHWAVKRTAQGPVRLFMWRKRIPGQDSKGTVVFVHGSSVQSVPAFDLQVPGQPHFSTMDTFVRMGFDTWCFDCEGYGRSDKHRDMSADIAAGADDAAVVVEEVARIESPADRPRVRTFNLHAGCRGRRGSGHGRGVRRCRTRLGQLDADRHVHRYVREPPGARSGKNHGPDTHGGKAHA